MMRNSFAVFCFVLSLANGGLAATNQSAVSSAEELKSFQVPPGFIVELAASEPDLPKPITVTWDDSGRMWSMTAVEYPVDANESPAQAESLYKNPGRDRVLVFDPPQAKPAGPAVLGKPRVFADGLAIPLGVLPYRDGALVHHGTEVVFLRDTDGDGRADKREVILSGFGVQDSHLMPHQFTYAPGGWIYLAQGAFNYSQVHARDGVVTRYDQTKLARFRPDGSEFEILSHGPCNIWGLVITRHGETWIQEANDYGYPTMRFEPGANYPGCGDTKFRPYAPMHPSISSFQMGGTGLSGLALSEDEDGFPEPWRDVMFVANPITRQVQALSIHRDVPGYRLEKLSNFMTSTDGMFRPIAIHFGPDACLYVVDWYNKIISHNEVPRNHPDRDKTRGRIWRVRHESQKPREIPNVAKASSAELSNHLASGNKWEWNAALHQIAERKPNELAPKLIQMAKVGRSIVTALPNATAATPRGEDTAPRQIRALWALESLRKADASLLRELTRNTNANVRREAVRIAGTQLSPGESLPLVAPLAEDSDHYVRSEVIRVASAQDSPWKHHIISGAEKRPDRKLSGAAIELLLQMAKPALTNANKPGAGYEREFERYLIRAALERHTTEVATFLESTRSLSLPAENRRLACSVLDGAVAARHLGALLTESRFNPSDEEWLLLHRHRNEPNVQKAMMPLNVYPHQKIVSAAVRRRDLIDVAKDGDWLAQAVNSVLRNDYAPAAAAEFHGTALQAARLFKLKSTADAVVSALQRSSGDTNREIQALKTLRELQAGPASLLYAFATNASRPVTVRNEAVAALSVSAEDAAVPALLTLWPTMNDAQRKPLIEQMSATQSGGEILLAALRSGTIENTELPFSALEKMRITLTGRAQMEELWKTVSTRMKPALRFNGTKDDYVSTKLTLAGPFTVEAWVRLDADISNLDGILGTAGRSASALDMNFAGAQFRVWLGSGENDVVIAKRKTVPAMWTHYAVTRDARGEFRIYINGELDGTSKRQSTATYSNLDLARTIPQTGGTAGWITEYRVWNVTRSASEILANFDRSFAGEKLPETLVRYLAAGKVEAPIGTLIATNSLRGKARIEGTLDAPPLLTAAEAKELEQKLAKFQALAESPGDATHGKQLFTTACLICHQAGGQGAGFAPNLDGSALRGTDGLLRALLTPSAAMEAGYRKFRVETHDGEIHEGFLVEQDVAGVTLRQPNAEPMKIPAANVKRAGFQNVSIMPEGLLEALEPKQVSDLFAYLRSLK